MTLTAERIDPPAQDPVSNVLKWVLLVVAILTFWLPGMGHSYRRPTAWRRCSPTAYWPNLWRCAHYQRRYRGGTRAASRKPI